MATLHDDDDDDNVAAVPAREGAEVELENEEGTQSEPEIEVVEDTGDERLSQQDEADDEGEQERPRRQKESAAERRARARVAKERDKRELEFQRRELARQDALIKDLQKGQVVSRVTELDNRIATAQTEAEQYDVIFGRAITANKGDDARAAAAIRDAAKQRAWDAHQQKEQLLIEAKKPQVSAPPYQGLADEFMAANPWYDHSGRDADSRLVKEIDAAVAKEYIPTSPAYWKELQRRVQKNLPQHFQSNDDSDDEGDTQVTQSQPRTRKGPPTGGSSRSNSSTSTQIVLSAERVAAMKESGKWDDPKTRLRMAKQYANYDKQNSRG